MNTGGDIPGAGAAGAIALFEFLLEFLLDGDFALGAEDVVGEEAEDAGLFEGHAVLGEELEDFGEGAVDVLGRGEGGPAPSASSVAMTGAGSGLGWWGKQKGVPTRASMRQRWPRPVVKVQRGGMVVSGSDFILELLGCTPLFCGSI